MALPEPHPGLVIRYAYLWRDEARRGRDEGIRDRPCVIVHATRDAHAQTIVTVAPITRADPRAPEDAVTLPTATKRRLGLDAQPSWIITTEVNRFRWPGPDLRPVESTAPRGFAYGMLPAALFRQLRDRIVAQARARRIALVTRGDS